jgi:hypothetical protein
MTKHRLSLWQDYKVIADRAASRYLEYPDHGANDARPFRALLHNHNRNDIIMQTLKKYFVYFLTTAFMFAGLTQSAQAGMIGTEQVQTVANAQQSRAVVEAALNRPDVMSQLEEMGVNKADAQARVAAMTDEEAATMAAKINSLPAGGDGIVGALIFIFIVLLITDILGLTKVFPFTRSIHH